MAHLTGSVVQESSDISYSTKEVSIIKYLSGYVFGTLYRRIHRSQSTRNMISVQCISVLLAGKSSFHENDSSDVFVCAKDVFVLLISVFEFFSHAESKFRISCPKTAIFIATHL